MCALWVLACGTLVLLASALPSPADAADFIVFDGLLYSGKPDLQAAHGLVPIVWVGDLWRPGQSTDTVDEVQIRSLFEHAAKTGGYYYLDIENWPLESVPPETRRQNIDKLTRVIDLARRTAPGVRLGFYGILPGITYWPLIRHGAAYGEWQDVNRALDPLAAHVDAVFPSLYTFYLDRDGWTSYARQTLTEARRYGKPVYAFLWPEFHDSTVLRGQKVPRDYWRAELDLCAEMADGVVLWGGWKQPWDEHAAWWQETLAFLRNRGATAADQSQHTGHPFPGFSQRQRPPAP
jgi:sugar phosphate isomerase/epimerase